MVGRREYAGPSLGEGWTMKGTSQRDPRSQRRSSFEGVAGEQLGEIYRYWAGETGVPPGDQALVLGELLRLMGDERRVHQRYQELTGPGQDLVAWLLGREGGAVSRSALDEAAKDLPVPVLKRSEVVVALVRRGFLREDQEREWIDYEDHLYRIPPELLATLRDLLGARSRDLDAQLSLRAFVRSLNGRELSDRLSRLGRPAALAEDRAALVNELSSPERIEEQLALLRDEQLRELARKALDVHGGILEARQLVRLGVDHLSRQARRDLETNLLGTLTDGDLSDLGLRFGARSLVVFLDLARGWMEATITGEVVEEPAPSADSLADLGAIRSYLDHHSVRVTREGSLYRSTARKMEGSVLTPGSRPGSPAESLSFLLGFLRDAELVRPDEKGRLRVTPDWRGFDARGPVEQSDLLLTYVLNDTRDAAASFHQPKLRRHFLALLREQGSKGWLDLRKLAHLARNRFFAGLERSDTAERYSKRYKYTTLPALVGPGGLTQELVSFARASLHLIGAVSCAQDAAGRDLIRLTRMGAALLDVDLPEEELDAGPLIVTADFEVVLFPRGRGIEVAHLVAKFARREKADYSIHYRIDQDSIMKAVAGGQRSESIISVLEENSRHELPENVVASIESWAAQVRPLEVRRALLLRTRSEEELDSLLRVREISEVQGERLNATTLEVFEDPTSTRLASALRAAGYFLR